MTGGWRKSSYSNPSGNCVEVQVFTRPEATASIPCGRCTLAGPSGGGKHTHTYWAMPPDGDLIDAETPEELTQLVQETCSR
jgi:hypothetical protein